MNKQEQVEKMTTYMAHFVDHIGKVLPDDIIQKLDELAAEETKPLAKTIYETMKLNQKLPGHRCPSVLGKMRHEFPADRRTGSTLKRSSCQGNLRSAAPPQQRRNI